MAIEDTDVREVTTFSLDTDSLDGLGNEPVPSEIVRDLLESKWQDNSEMTPRPEIHVLNDTTFSGQGDLRKSDWIIVDASSVEESQRGFTYELKDIEVPVVISLHTVHSRQRLYNLMAEVRRIIYKHHITTRPYQMIYWDSFNEDSDGKNRYWQGDCHIRLTSEGVPVFKGVVSGMGSENIPVNQR